MAAEVPHHGIRWYLYNGQKKAGQSYAVWFLEQWSDYIRQPGFDI
jgi:hypothetical protein